MSPQQRANLRVCASCEWIFKGGSVSCPICQFGSYGARYVYGNKCYKYFETQEPWKNKKIAAYSSQLYTMMKAQQLEDRKREKLNGTKYEF